MEYIFNHPWELGLLLAIVLAVALDLGRRVAVRYQIELAPQRKEQMGTIRDGLFILVSLLLGFTLTFAGSRFMERRSLLVEEAISIGTTYLRADTLPQPYRDRSKQLLREYVDARLELDNAGANTARFDQAVNRSKHIQEELWLDAATVAQNDRTAVTAVYVNSLNETIDLHEKRIAAFENRVPPPMWLLIISVSLIAVFTRGSTLTAYFLTSSFSWSILRTTARHPPTSCIWVNLICGKRRSFASIETSRFSRWAMMAFGSTARARPSKVILKRCNGKLCDERQLFMIASIWSRFAIQTTFSSAIRQSPA